MEDILKVLLKGVSAFLAILVALIGMFGNLGGGGEGEGESTTKPTTSTTETTKDDDTPSIGAFYITTYGYGHGAGMSQEGAIAMANSGNNYVQILTHYFTGTKVVGETSTPATIKYGTTDMPIVEFLCKSVKQEIGPGAPEAAVKAQAAAIYSFAKYYKYTVKTSQIAIDKNFAYAGTDVEKYVLSYLGMDSATATPTAKYVSADDGKSAAMTVFCASVAGKTTDAKNVWGGNGYSYLVPVTSPEIVSKKVAIIPAEAMKDYIEDYDINNNLSSDPAAWIKITAHDSAVNSNLGYATTVSIGERSVSGYKFRTDVLDSTIRSHCFSIEYIGA